MNLHIPTMFAAIVTISVTLALLVGTVSGGKRREGLSFWAAALFSHGLAYVLLALRGTINDIASIVVANALLATALALFAEGLYQFYERPPPRFLIWFPVALISGLFLLLGDLRLRLFFGGVIFSAQCLVPLLLLHRQRPTTTGRGQHFLFGGLAFVSILFATRAGLSISGSGVTLSLMAANQSQSFLFLAAIICLILLAIGLVLMTKERSDERYRILALHDELTGLDNRRAILRALEQQASLARRSRQPLTLLMMDIDHFKRVNDSFGHIEGDKVLRMVANSITARLRTQDLVGRFGGEEFLAILPATTAQGGFELAEALRTGIADSRIAARDGRTIGVTISIGVHQVGESSGEALANLINAADQALYRAKDNGRNRVEIG